MKKVHPRIAFGAILSVLLDILLLIQRISGIKIVSEDNSFILIIIVLPITLFLGRKLSKGYYDEVENNDNIFRFILVIAMIVLVIIIVVSKN